MHRVMNDESLKDFSAILISEPHVWRNNEGKAILTPTTHHNWIKIEPSILDSEGRWAYRSMIWTRADLEMGQVHVKSSDITAVVIRLPRRQILLFSVYVQGSDTEALRIAISNIDQAISSEKTRCSALDVIVTGDFITVEPMGKSHALTLFRKKLYNDLNDDEVLDLLESLDYMPLAISQAAAYIRQRAPRVTVSKYLKDFRRSEKDRASLLNVAVRDRRRDGQALHSIITTWQISFKYIQEVRPSAAHLLSLMSFFVRQGISEELLTGRYETADSNLDFEDDIHMLQSYSLVAIGTKCDVFEMHRLAQFATRKWLEQGNKVEEWKEKYIAVMAKAFPVGRYKNWIKCQSLFPHIEMVLEYRPINRKFLQEWATILFNAAWYTRERMTKRKRWIDEH